MIEELFQAFEEAGANAGPEELADILWLAARIGGADTPAARDLLDACDEHEALPLPKEPAMGRAAAGAEPTEEFYSATDVTNTPHPAQRGVDLVRIRRAASLQDPLALMRALRPLGRSTRQAGYDSGELDEELTVRRTVEQHLPTPVLRPRRGRWLDLALVVDAHHSMLLWHDLVTELRRVFVQSGIFRDVRTWYLRGTGPDTDEPLSVARTPNGEPRSVQEVSDPSGHRLILVVTDTVAGGWAAPGIAHMLRQWSAHGPVALLNVLPRRLWDRGAVRTRPLVIRSVGPAAPNASWRVGPAAQKHRRIRRQRSVAGSITIPVVEAGAASVSVLAELVAGNGQWTRVPCLTIARTPKVVPPAPPEPLVGDTDEVDEILRRFRSGASPVAQRLAGYLSAVPLNLPVMNLVRQIMLPDSEHGHLAEVALGGLFLPWEQDAREGRADPDRVPFRFRARVKEALLGGQRRDAITAVQELVRREMGAYVTERGAISGGDFLAGRGVGHGEGDRGLAPYASPFAARAGAADAGGSEEEPGPRWQRIADLVPEADPVTEYLEREVDEHLRAVMAAAEQGRNAFVLLEGEPGSGKTTAIRRAVATLPSDWTWWSPRDADELVQGVARLGPRSVVTLDDLPSFALTSVLHPHRIAQVFIDLIENTDRAPVVVLGEVASADMNALMDDYSEEAQGFRYVLDRMDVLRLSPLPMESETVRRVDKTRPQGASKHRPAHAPEFSAVAPPDDVSSPAPDRAGAHPRWPGEPSHTRIVMLASSAGPVRAGSQFEHLGTGFLLSPRLILTAAHILQLRSRHETVKVRNKLGPVTADGWADCRVLWTHDTYDAALLLTEDNVAEPTTDARFSAPRWARLTGNQPLSPCHITGLTVAAETSPHMNGHLIGALHRSAHSDTMYEFEPTEPVPQRRSTKSYTRGMSGAPVFFGDLLLGLAVAMRHDPSGRPRLVVADISALVNDKRFTEVCGRYMSQIPRLHPLPATASASVGDNRAGSQTPGLHAPRVFISYAYEDDGGAHAEQVQSLWRLLRAEGIDARLDRVDAVASRDWTAWMRREIEAADFILVIASPAYKRRAETPETDPSAGVAFEARLLRNELAHTPPAQNHRILPVVLPSSTSKDLPAFLRVSSPVVVDSLTDSGTEQLLRRLTEQRHVTAADGAGLAAAEQAIAMYRRQAASDADAYEPELATALSKHADRLAEARRWGEALAAEEEALQIRQRLAAARPSAYEKELAASLSNLGNRLADVGRRQEALSAAQQAVDIRRRLAASHPDGGDLALARSLSNLSNRLAEVGRRADALAAIQDATVIYRRRFADGPPAYEAELAAVLSNLGTALSAVGRSTEALAAAEEAVAIRRRLAEVAPDASGHDLARALHNLGALLSEAGRPSQALAPTAEALALYRQSADSSSATWEPELAAAFHNTGLRLSEARQPAEALAAIERAITIRRRLAEANPEIHSPDLAKSLSAAAWVRIGEQQNLSLALGEAKEAVELFRRFAAQLPAAFTGDLRRALEVQALALDALGNAEEADQVRRSLASLHPGETSALMTDVERNSGLELAEAPRRVLPVYLICDVSGSMAGDPIDAVNEMITQVHHLVRGQPILAENVRLGIISFSSTADVAQPLANLAEVDRIPALSAGGVTNYSAAFDLLEGTLATDIATLQDENIQIYRPLIFFVSDGQPTDGYGRRSEWVTGKARGALSPVRVRPNVIAIGFRDADPETMRRIATVGAYVAAPGTAPRDAIAGVLAVLARTIDASVRSSDPDAVVLDPTAAPGFQALEAVP